MANKMGQGNPILINAQLRNALLQTAPRMRKSLGTFTGAVGQTTRIKAFNVGILTGFRLLVSIPLTIGTATAVASLKGPYNAISKIRFTDYDGTDRVVASGFQTWIWNSVRGKAPFGLNNMGPIYDVNGSTEKSGIITNPAQALAVGAQTVSFYLDVPIAYDQDNDLRGAILSQTAVGEMYLSIDWNSSFYTNGDIESVYSGAATTTVTAITPSVTVDQLYLSPQQINGQTPLPPLDLTTVYEFNGNVRSTDNLAAASEKLINYPNVRSVIGAYYNYITNATMLASHLTRVRTIANGNNVMEEWLANAKILEQRRMVNGDLQAGVYWNDHRAKPIETALFGNIQTGFTPATVGTNSNLELAFESFYTKGATLPGIMQSS